MNNFFSSLENRIAEVDSLLCIGLDPHPSDLSETTPDGAKGFCESIIHASADYAAAYKPNAAFFEALGPGGISALKDVISMIPDDIPVILDAKRGDIASTAQAYAKSAFKILGADAITINPYLGSDAVAPFIENPHHGAFLLCKTSNPGASDLQDLPVVGDGISGNRNVPEPLYIQVAKFAKKLNLNNNLGIVVGATQIDSLIRIREVAPDIWILAPGVGAQGGDIRRALQAGLRKDGYGILIPVSRGISRSTNPSDTVKALRDRINQERSSLRNQSIAIHDPGLPELHAMIADGLLEAGCVKFGRFTLKSGDVSPIYIDLRRLVGFPDLMSKVSKAYDEILSGLRFDQLGALPYAALPITSAISLLTGRPMIYPRKEVKEYGTKAQIEGVYVGDQRVVVIDDLISTGGSKFEGIQKLESAGLVVEDVVVLIDRSSDGEATLKEHGYRLHSVIKIADLLAYYAQKGKVDKEKIAEAMSFLKI